MSCSTCRHEERDHFDGASPFPGVCAVNACPCTFYRNGVPVDAAQGRARTTEPRQCLCCCCLPGTRTLPCNCGCHAHDSPHRAPWPADVLTTCLATPPVAGCNCGLAWADPARVAEEHKTRLAAVTRSKPASPASTILAMAGALGELAEVLHFRTDVTWCRELGADLRGFARQLPTQDGGEDAAREVRHA